MALFYLQNVRVPGYLPRYCLADSAIASRVSDGDRLRAIKGLGQCKARDPRLPKGVAY